MLRKWHQVRADEEVIVGPLRIHKRDLHHPDLFEHIANPLILPRTVPVGLRHDDIEGEILARVANNLQDGAHHPCLAALHI